ncbi:hypothetical protein [Alkalibacillus silvisoli]|uniref:Uncharacterized protein n=1 Tax=Alkalibacillus silvisoli TaxID=392823 RepID=A0ABN1A087_9BACI
MIKKQKLKTTENIKAQYMTYCKVGDPEDGFDLCILCLKCEATMAVYSDGSESFLHCGC